MNKKPAFPTPDNRAIRRGRDMSMSLTRRIWYVAGFLLLTLAMTGSLNAAPILKEITYSALAGNRTQIVLSMSEQISAPGSFTTDSPARIALDFSGVKNGLAAKTKQVGVGVVHSINTIEAGDRTRVVINLVESTPYDLKIDGNDVLVTLEGGAGSGAVVESSAQRQLSAVASKASSHGVSDIDFRRGEKGEGRIIVTLSDPSAVADIREEGTRVILDFLDTSLPPELVRRLDVTDFATPVLSVDAKPRGRDATLDVKATGEYEYMAYQTDNLFTLEFRPLTKEEKEDIQKKKRIYTGDRLSLNFQDIEVRAVLQLLADFTGLNMVVSDTVGGSLTLRLKNVPWDHAMDIILKTKGLSMRRTDNVILVAPTEEIAAREKLELESQQQIEELAPLKSEFIQANYAQASDLATLLKSSDNRLMSERGNVTVDERTNTLLVQDTAAKLEDIRRLISRLDIPVRQVLIESRIVIANDDFTRDLGVRLGFTRSNRSSDNELLIGGGVAGHLPGTANTDKGSFLGNIAGTPPGAPFNSSIENPAGSGAEALLVNLPATAATSGVNFLIGKVGSYLLQLELSAMQKEGRGEVVSSPRIITSDQHQATIKQGVEIPYQEATSSGATSVSFKEAVLQLDVTPHITPDDRIMMELEITKDSPDFSRQVLGVPPVDTRSVQTAVLVDNGETVVLGGVYERTRQSNIERVPFFGDLPYVGTLFRNTTNQDDNRELLVFVTPKILKETLTVR